MTDQEFRAKVMKYLEALKWTEEREGDPLEFLWKVIEAETTDAEFSRMKLDSIGQVLDGKEPKVRLPLVERVEELVEKLEALTEKVESLELELEVTGRD